MLDLHIKISTSFFANIRRNSELVNVTVGRTKRSSNTFSS